MAEVELKNQRQYNAKVFADSGPMKMRFWTAPVHYNNKFGVGDGVGGFREIDNSITFNIANNRWEILFNNFQAAMPLTSDGNFIFRDGYQGKDQTIRFQARGTNAVAGVLMTDGAIKGIGPQYILYSDAYGTGTDLIIGTRTTSLVKLVRIRNGFYPVADTNFDFAYKFPDGVNMYAADSAKTALSGTQLVTAGTADTVAMGNVPATRPLYVGVDQADGQNWFTELKAVKVWDSAPTTYTAPNTATTQKRQFLPWKWVFDSVNNVLVQRKTIPVAFFTGAIGDVFTDAVYAPTASQDSYYGTSFTLGPNPGTVTIHCGGFGDQYFSFLQWTISGAPANSAILKVLLYVYNLPNALSPQPVAAHCTSSWLESTLSSTVNPTISATTYTFVAGWPNATQWQHVDITNMFRGWNDASITNNGLRIAPTVNNPSNTDSQMNSFDNVDTPPNRPYIDVLYGSSQGNYDVINAIRPHAFGPGHAR